MENLSGHTETQLLKMINDAKVQHESLKNEIIDFTYQIDELEIAINRKLDLLHISERNYVDLIEELNKRNVV